MKFHQISQNPLYGLVEKKSVPLSVTLELTYRCNEKCLHCYLPETRAARPPRTCQELTTAEWYRVLQELSEAGTIFLRFTGGEVLARQDFDEILRRARELRFYVEIATNATLLTPGMADLWAELQISGVGISVYGHNASLHDRVTQLPGSFDKTMRGIQLLQERKIPVELRCPLMNMNFFAIAAIEDLARKLGVEYQFNHLLAPRKDGSDSPLILSMDHKQLKQFICDDHMISKRRVLESFSADPEGSLCMAGRVYAAINPFGDVVPCLHWPVPAGNVKEKPFKGIWQRGAIFLKARSYTNKDVKDCSRCGQAHFMHCLGMSQTMEGDPLI
ncbi:MAG: radical SAM protein, partial [Elusimicrobia bacterium]|nr:radical SAM protein [Elusimicrobiota bacterium]